MIMPYFGEFLISPCATEARSGACSYGCKYCFACNKMKGSKRRIDYPGEAVKAIRKPGLIGDLVAMGYPVCISNHSDPFAPENIRGTQSLVGHIGRMGGKAAYQTKGGDIDRILEIAQPKSSFLVTITGDKEERNPLEPNTPLYSDRIRLIKALTDAGHIVGALFMPLKSEWYSDISMAFRDVSDAGAIGVWANPLHIGQKQSQLSGLRITKESELPTVDQYIDFTWWLKALCDPLGMECYSAGWPHRTGFFEKLYGSGNHKRIFPIIIDYVNYCYDNYAEGDLVGGDEFVDGIVAALPKLKGWPVYMYIGGDLGHRGRRLSVPKTATMRDAVRWKWERKIIGDCPCFEESESIDGSGASLVRFVPLRDKHNREGESNG